MVSGVAPSVPGPKPSIGDRGFVLQPAPIDKGNAAQVLAMEKQLQDMRAHVILVLFGTNISMTIKKRE